MKMVMAQEIKHSFVGRRTVVMHITTKYQLNDHKKAKCTKYVEIQGFLLTHTDIIFGDCWDSYSFF